VGVELTGGSRRGSVDATSARPGRPRGAPVAREEPVTASAAGLAYDAFGSLVPLGLVAFAVVSHLGEFGPVARAFELVTGVGAAQFEATFERVAADESWLPG